YTLARGESTALARRFLLSVAQDSIQLPASEIESFLQEFYPMLLEADIRTQLSDGLTEPKEFTPVPRLYLSEGIRQLDVELRVAYDNYEIQHETGRNEILLPARTGDNGRGPLLWSVARDRPQETDW